MTFAGAYFLYQLVASFAAIVVTIIFYLAVSNLLFDDATKPGWKIALMVLSVALGGFGAFFFYKFSVLYAVPIIAGGAGAFGFKLLTNVAGVRNEYAVIAILVAGAAIGVFIGYKLNEWVRTIGTAFLGAYMAIRGTGFVFGGFPEGTDDVNIHKVKADDKIVWYFVGFIALFIAGSIVQYKWFHHNEELKQAQLDAFNKS